MTNEEAVKMLKAKLKCLIQDVSGVYDDCNRRLCNECCLNYEQGNMGQQAEYLRMSIEALEQEPCEDCISRQVVMNALCDGCELFKNGEQTCHSKCEEYHFLATLPSVTPQPKTGHWYKSSCDICYTCSFCGVTNASGTKYNYCPNCGAKMTESEEKE